MSHTRHCSTTIGSELARIADSGVDALHQQHVSACTKKRERSLIIRQRRVSHGRIVADKLLGGYPLIVSWMASVQDDSSSP